MFLYETLQYAPDSPKLPVVGGIQPDGQRFYQVPIIVASDSLLDGPKTLLMFLASIGHKKYQPYVWDDRDTFLENDLECLLDSIDGITRLDKIPQEGRNKGFWWMAILNYRPFVPNYWPRDYHLVDWRGENPLFFRYKNNYTMEITEEVANEAYQVVNLFGREITQDKMKILNSAGDPFENNPTHLKVRIRLEIVRNELYPFNASRATEFIGKFNSTPFLGADKWTVQCQSIAPGDLQYHQSCGYYYGISYNFLYEPESHVVRILDRGFREKSGVPCATENPVGADKMKEIQDDLGQPIKFPMLLDGFGYKLGKCFKDEDIRYREYLMDNAIDMNQLQLEQYG